MLIIIPKKFRIWFYGKKKIEAELEDIEEYFPEKFIATITIKNAPFWGKMTFAVLQDEEKCWYISA